MTLTPDRLERLLYHGTRLQYTFNELTEQDRADGFARLPAIHRKAITIGILRYYVPALLAQSDIWRENCVDDTKHALFYMQTIEAYVVDEKDEKPSVRLAASDWEFSVFGGGAHDALYELVGYREDNAVGVGFYETSEGQFHLLYIIDLSGTLVRTPIPNENALEGVLVHWSKEWLHELCDSDNEDECDCFA